MKTFSRIALGAALLAAAAGTVRASATDDDLAVVKRAVRQDTSARVAQAKPAPDATITVTDDDDKEWERSRGTRRIANRDLKWFKVRVVEKGSKRARVTVNLPIALVRALDDFPIDIGRHRGWRDGAREGQSTIRLGEVLATLEGGQSLVEIDDDDATVRVWVE